MRISEHTRYTISSIFCMFLNPYNALVLFAERRKINMKKRTNLGKKLVTMLVSVGFFAVLITVLNLMALQAIRGKNNVLIEQFRYNE